MTNPRDYALPDPSLDPEAQRIAWERDRNERAARHMMGSAVKAAREEGHKEGHEKGHTEGHGKGHKEGHEEGREEGHKEGREEGRREKAAMLAQLLTKKFGPLPDKHRERVEGADGATLKRWFEASFDAVSIDELFA